MNQINVNMTPTPIGVPTLHCSQNDRGREFQIKLHNNGEGIDSSGFVAPIIYPVSVGGTEQLLPVNTSTPTTSPILADIQYPDELRTDQYFTYRECPTTEDGYAKGVSVYGNSIGWNQLVQNGNFESASGWLGNNATISVSNNILTGTASNEHQTVGLRKQGFASVVANHKYLFSATMSCSVASADAIVRLYGAYDVQSTHLSVSSTKTRLSWIVQPSNSFNADLYIYPKFSASSPLAVGSTFTVQDVMCIDLTLLNDSRVTDYTSFRQYYPLDWYSFNQGTLINFNGTGVKTVGKNQYYYSSDTYTRNCTVTDDNGTLTITATGADCYIGDIATTGTSYTSVRGTLIDVRAFESVAVNTNNNFFSKNYVTKYDENKVSVGYIAYSSEKFVVNVSDCSYISFRFGYANSVSGTSYIVKPQVEIGNTQTDFEPYTSSTTSLPISTYFPTGMKSAGDVYDEMNSKASTRVGRVDLGSLAWSAYGSGNSEFTAELPLMKVGSTNAVTSIGATPKANYSQWVADRPNSAFYKDSNGKLHFRYGSYTSASDFQTAMSGVYLNFELSTYTEVDITSASLVSEYGEIPLKPQDDYLVGECTSEFSQNPGFHDCKVKLTDVDGECYSQKIQLHVEEKP